MCLHCLQLLFYHSFSLLIYYYQEEIPQLCFVLGSAACMLNTSISSGMNDKDKQCFLRVPAAMGGMGTDALLRQANGVAAAMCHGISGVEHFVPYWKGCVAVSPCFMGGFKALRSPGLLSAAPVCLQRPESTAPLSRVEHFEWVCLMAGLAGS